MGVKYGVNLRGPVIQGCQVCGSGATDPPLFPGKTLLIDHDTQSAGLRIIVNKAFQKLQQSTQDKPICYLCCVPSLHFKDKKT